jgi:hypothetical protein
VGEFLGGVEEVGGDGWATDVEARRVRRTANHPEYLGKCKREPLPQNARTLA